MSFRCDDCQLDFEADEARCPNCLRKSPVREAGGLPSTQAAEQRLPVHIALLRIFASLLLTLALGSPFLFASALLDRLGLTFPLIIGSFMFGFVSIKMSSGNHDPGFIPYRMVLAMSGTLAGATILAGFTANLILGDAAVALRVAVAVALFIGLLALVLRPLARWMDSKP